MARSLTKTGFSVGGAIRNLEEFDASAEAGNGLLKLAGNFFRQIAGDVASIVFNSYSGAKKNNRATL